MLDENTHSHADEPRQSQPGREFKMGDKPDYMPRFPGSGRLKRKRALITGADSGIGRAIAILFAREGADIAFVYLEEDKDAEETRRLIEAEGARAVAIRGDVASKQFCEDAVRQAVAALGGLDILVNNAAEQHMDTDVEDIDEDQLKRTFATNLFGYVFMIQAALPQLKSGSAIVNTTSVTAYRGQTVLVDYSATKGAIVSLTRSLSQQLADKDIRVNAVAPGPIWTPLIPATFPPKKVESFGKHVPLGRPGQPNEVAPSYLFLASQDASYMTGQVLHPNGGEMVGS
jgi:NAD(P)-dependent dehydrogenase (short-subunit alcohol dehydrogenase family)